MSTSITSIQLRTYRSAISVFITIDQLQGSINGINSQTHKNRTKNLFGIAPHVWLDIRDDCGTNPIALCEKTVLRLLATPVQQDSSAFGFSTSNEILNALFGLWGNHSTKVGVWLKTAIEL